jgi:diguanylate cyclase (GGDEF)-like protein
MAGGLFNVVLLRLSLDVERASRITLAMAFSLLLALLLHGGFERTGPFWLGLFPLIAYFFKGSRRGSGWVAALIFAILGMALAQRLGELPTPFSVSTLMVLVGSLVASSVLVHIYERTREAQACQLLEVNRQLKEEARERRAAEEALRRSDARLRHLAHHDQLTQLPNRLLLLDRLEQAMRLADRSGRLLAVIFVDLDNFKPVNDAIGHEGGDVLLVQAAGRLAGTLRSADTVGRYGGDEFVVIAGHLTDKESAYGIADKIITALAPPFLIGECEFRIGASLGIAFYPEDGQDCDSLISRADAAMYVAKKNGKGCWSDQAKKMEGRGCLPSIGV